MRWIINSNEVDRAERLEERLFERQGKALDRAQMIRLVVTAMSGFFGNRDKGERKRKRKWSKRRCAKRLGIASTGNSSSSSNNSTDDSESTDDDDN